MSKKTQIILGFGIALLGGGLIGNKYLSPSEAPSPIVERYDQAVVEYNEAVDNWHSIPQEERAHYIDTIIVQDQPTIGAPTRAEAAAEELTKTKGLYKILLSHPEVREDNRSNTMPILYAGLGMIGLGIGVNGIRRRD